MQNKTIYLIHHGNTRSNTEKVYAGWSKEPLAEKGIMQANTAGKQMRNWGISVLYTSPIKRAIHTAEILNEHIKTKLTVDLTLL